MPKAKVIKQKPLTSPILECPPSQCLFDVLAVDAAVATRPRQVVSCKPMPATPILEHPASRCLFDALALDAGAPTRVPGGRRQKQAAAQARHLPMRPLPLAAGDSLESMDAKTLSTATPSEASLPELSRSSPLAVSVPVPVLAA